MKKIVANILIATFTLGSTPAFADDDHGGSSSSSGGGGAAGAGIAIGAAVVIGILIWAFSNKKESAVPAVADPMTGKVSPSIDTPVLNEQPGIPTPSSVGIGNIKGMEY